MKQTAVQYLAQKTVTLIMSRKDMRDFIKFFKEARKIENQQIKEAHLNGQSEWDIKSLGDIQKKLSEEYYKETYEQK